MALGTPYLVCGGNAGGGSATLQVTVTQTTTAGDSISVWVTGNSGTFTSVTDSAGNTYSAEGTEASNGSLHGQWFVALNTAVLTSGTSWIELTLSGSAGSKGLSAVGCSGVAATGAVDQTPTPTTGSSASPSITSGTLSQASELALAGVVAGNGATSITWGNSFTAQDTEHPASAQVGFCGSLTVSSTSPVTASGTITSANWAMGLITLEAAASPVTVSGAVSALSLAAPAGTPSFPISVAGAVSPLALAALAGTPTVASPVSVAGVTATLALAAPAGTPVAGGGTPAIVNVWPIADTDGYGPQAAKVANSTGNALIAVVCAGTDNPGASARFTIADDEQNWWIYSGSDVALYPGANRRVDVWVAPNAQACTHVSVSESQIFSGVTGLIFEVANFPEYAQVQLATTAGGYGTSLSLSGTATVSEFLIAAAAAWNVTSGGFTITPPSTGSWATVDGTVLSGSTAGDMGASALSVSTEVASGSITASFSWSGSKNFAGLLIGFSMAPTAPVQDNANWPALKIEAAFGYQPGSPASTAMPAWTDITNYVMDDAGNAVLKTTRGRDYELTQPEAGSLSMLCLNSTGEFNPANSSSPFYPDVLPEVPVRVSATWEGRTYGIAYSYASKWPQAFPDGPQWGMTPYRGNDGISIASNIQLPSAYAGEVLADLPFAYFPLGDYYNEANGFPFANLSRTNTKPAIGVDNTSRTALPLLTGQEMDLAGDTGTGVGTTAFATGASVGTGGPGLFYRDANFPVLSGGFTMECWALIELDGTTAVDVSLLTVMGAQGNYNNSATMTPSAGDGSRFALVAQSGAGSPVSLYLNDFTGDDQVAITSTSPVMADANLHHYVATCTNNGTTWTIKAYKDGVLLATQTGTAVPEGIDAYMLAIGPVVLGGGTRASANYTIGQVAIYDWVLPASRILAHYTTGSTAAAGDDVITRWGKLNGWDGAGIPYAGGQTSPSPLIGNADQIQGSATADAAYDLATDEGGFYYAQADATGAIWYASRVSLYNRTPKFVLGDDPAIGEIPYLAGSGFDYDDSYLFNIVSSQRTISASQQLYAGYGGEVSLGQYNSYGAMAVEAGLASEAEFFPRGPLQQDIETTSDQDAYDRASWSLAKYQQPVLRANEVQLDPASNPAAWEAALNTEQGDVVTVNRRPVGAPEISLNCMVQQVKHDIGPGRWRTTFSLSPYFPENNVVQLDATGYNKLSDGGVLAW